MARSRAEFRALMDMTGMTCGALARATGVDEGTVEWWATPFTDDEIPEEAWDVLDEASEAQAKVVRRLVGLALMDDTPVTIPYWPADTDVHNAENAQNRALAAALMVHGIEVAWREPKGDATPSATIPSQKPVEMTLRDALRHMVEGTGKSQREISLGLGKRETWLNQALTRQGNMAAGRAAYIAGICGWKLRLRKHGTNKAITIDPEE